VQGPPAGANGVGRKGEGHEMKELPPLPPPTSQGVARTEGPGGLVGGVDRTPR
jgi:hypothetical protein